MYKPKFNQVLVEIDDKDATWGKGNDDSFGGETFREGKLIDWAICSFPSGDYAHLDLRQWTNILAEVEGMKGKTIMWNEGHEAGKVFDHDGKKYAFISWYDIIGVKEDD